MFQVTREIDFCFGHRVMGAADCGQLHGHNGRAVITLESESLDSLGMVLDFSEIKRVVSAWIDEHLDHRMILADDDPARSELEHLGEPLFITPNPPTRDEIAAQIFAFTRDAGFPIVRCEVVDTV